MKKTVLLFCCMLLFADRAWACHIVSDLTVRSDAVSGGYGSMRIVRLVDGGLDYVVNIAEGRGSKYFYRPKDGISAAVSPLWGGAVYETYSLDGAIAVFEGDEILGSSLVIVRDTHTITVECASHRVQRVQLEALAQKFGQAAE